MLIELLVVLLILLALHVLASGFELSVSLIEVVVWVVGGLTLAVGGGRYLTNTLIDGLLGASAGGRKRGPAADGLALLKKGDLGAAEFALRRCLDRNPADAEALRGLSEIAYQRAEYEQYLQLTARLLSQRDALRSNERVAVCHRQADVCLQQLKDLQRAVEALARIEMEFPGTTDALRARQRIERIVSAASTEEE